MTPLTNQIGTATIFIAATNDVGLTTSTTLVVTVSSPIILNQQFFGTSNLNWQTSGDAPWFGQMNISHDGFPSAQSGSVGNYGESSLEASVVGPGTLSFSWRSSSETNFDWLVFESPLMTNQISGQVDWQQQVVELGPELQTIRWRYQKDQNTVEGLDAGWLAQVSFIPSAWLEPPSGLTDGQFRQPPRTATWARRPLKSRSPEPAATLDFTIVSISEQHRYRRAPSRDSGARRCGQVQPSDWHCRQRSQAMGSQR